MVNEYKRRVGTSGGRGYGGAYVAPTLLQTASDALVSAGHDLLKEREQQKQLDYKTAEARAEQRLMVKQAELQDKINSGKYAGVVEEYNEYFNATMDSLRDSIDDDAYYQNSVNQFSTAYTRNLLQIKREAGRAQKSAYVDSVNNKMSLLGEEYLTASDARKTSILGEANKHYSSFVDLGLMSAGEAEMEERAFLRQIESNRISAIAKHDPETALANLEDIQESAGVFDELSYQTQKAQLEGVIEASKKKVDDATKLMQKFLAEPQTLSSNDVSKVYSSRLNAISRQTKKEPTPQQMSAVAVDLSKQTGLIPKQVLMSAQAAFDVDANEITMDMAQRALVSAQTIAASSPSAKSARGAKETVVRSEAMKALTDIGISPVESLKLISRAQNIEKDIGMVEITKEVNALIENGVPSIAREDILTTARTLKASGVEDAASRAYNLYKERGSELFGRYIPYSPSVFFQTTPKQIEKVVRRTVKQAYPDMDTDGVYLYPTSDTVSKLSERDLTNASWVIYRDVETEFGKVAEYVGDIKFEPKDVIPEPNWFRKKMFTVAGMSDTFFGTDYMDSLMRKRMIEVADYSDKVFGSQILKHIKEGMVRGDTN